jgi:hypothetical protein
VTIPVPIDVLTRVDVVQGLKNEYVSMIGNYSDCKSLRLTEVGPTMADEWLLET